MSAPTSMALEENALRVAIIGTGVIGTSWAAHFLGRGARVIATDPAPGAADRLRAGIDRIWPGLERIGLAPGASRERLEFSTDLEQCLTGADFVQENAPENREGKQQLMQSIDAATAPGVIVASSSSGLLPTELQERCRRDPGRVLVGHPFHPPHLMPLVEVVGGRATNDATILRALAFYRSVGKHPIHIRKELPGHVANRLQAALWREAFSLVEQGAATVADIDDAIRHGPGLRWAILGPFLTLHLTGGKGGMEEILRKMGPSVEEWWAGFQTPHLNPELVGRVVEGVETLHGQMGGEGLEAWRDDMLNRLLALKAEGEGTEGREGGHAQ
jgi:3-hydroxyacyl-CoA dehydrogenase